MLVELCRELAQGRGVVVVTARLELAVLVHPPLQFANARFERAYRAADLVEFPGHRRKFPIASPPPGPPAPPPSPAAPPRPAESWRTDRAGSGSASTH